MKFRYLALWWFIFVSLSLDSSVWAIECTETRYSCSYASIAYVTGAPALSIIGLLYILFRKVRAATRTGYQRGLAWLIVASYLLTIGGLLLVGALNTYFAWLDFDVYEISGFMSSGPF